MTPRYLLSSSLLLGGLLVAGCVKTPERTLEERIEVLEREHEPERLLERAEALASVGDYTRAEQYLNLALQSGAEERRVLPLLLEVCTQDQRYRDAAQYVEHYLRRHPNEFRLRFVLGTLYAGIGDVEPARAQFEKLLAVQPEHAEAHYALAVLLRDQLGNFGGADRHFREYLRLRPRGPHSEEASASLLERVR